MLHVSDGKWYIYILASVFAYVGWHQDVEYGAQKPPFIWHGCMNVCMLSVMMGQDKTII